MAVYHPETAGGGRGCRPERELHQDEGGLRGWRRDGGDGRLQQLRRVQGGGGAAAARGGGREGRGGATQEGGVQEQAEHVRQLVMVMQASLTTAPAIAKEGKGACLQ